MALPASKETLVDKLYSAIKDDICMGRLEPGSKLQLGDIREQHNVSLSVVREAVTRLASERLLQTKSQHGFTVWPLSHDDLIDLTRVRIEIETIALRDSFSTGGPEWEAELLGAHHMLVSSMAINRPEPLEGPNYEWMRAHSQFHAALVAACPSPLLKQMRQQLYDSAELYRHWSAFLTDQTRDVAQEHRALLDAALAHDLEQGMRLIREHIQLTTDMLVESGHLSAT